MFSYSYSESNVIFNPLGTLLRGLLAIAILVAGVLVIKEWVDELPRQTHHLDPVTNTEVVTPATSLGERLHAWRPSPDRSTGLLVAGALLLLLGISGRYVSPLLWRKGSPATPLPCKPRQVRLLASSNGYPLLVEEYGPEDGPPLVLVHGLGEDRTVWRETIEDLGSTFRIFAFDLVGHGESAHPRDATYTLEAAARDLDDVLSLAGPEGAVLAGHSMGGMIAMTWCSTYQAEAAGLAGLVLVHTTPTNPFATMRGAALHLAIQKPILEPLLRLTPRISPLIRFTHALEYLNGALHWLADFQMFAGHETREQLDRSARFHRNLDPAAVARFTLAMTRFEARQDLMEFEMPATVVAGDQDNTTQLEASREIVERIQGAKLVVLEAARHLGFVEWRQQFAEVVGRFHVQHRTEHSARSGPTAA